MSSQEIATSLCSWQCCVEFFNKLYKQNTTQVYCGLLTTYPYWRRHFFNGQSALSEQPCLTYVQLSGVIRVSLTQITKTTACGNLLAINRFKLLDNADGIVNIIDARTAPQLD